MSGRMPTLEDVQRKYHTDALFHYEVSLMLRPLRVRLEAAVRANELKTRRCHLHGGDVRDPADPDTCYCGTYVRAKADVSELVAKVQYLVDFMDRKSQLEEHCFTFPDGDTWHVTEADA